MQTRTAVQPAGAPALKNNVLIMDWKIPVGANLEEMIAVAERRVAATEERIQSTEKVRNVSGLLVPSVRIHHWKRDLAIFRNRLEMLKLQRIAPSS